jgi:hypothetical protein
MIVTRQRVAALHDDRFNKRTRHHVPPAERPPPISGRSRIVIYVSSRALVSYTNEPVDGCLTGADLNSYQTVDSCRSFSNHFGPLKFERARSALPVVQGSRQPPVHTPMTTRRIDETISCHGFVSSAGHSLSAAQELLLS